MKDSAIARRLWLVLPTAVLTLVPFTLYSTFLVNIAQDVGTTPAYLGALRGGAGVAALIVGLGLAPLIDRFRGPSVVGLGLLLLAVGCLAGAIGDIGTLVAFCLLIGAATAIVSPVLVADASRRFEDERTAGRAATMVTSVTTLGAVAAGPVIGVLAVLAGWRAVLVTTAVLAITAAVGFIASAAAAPAAAPEAGWLSSARALAGRRDLLALVATSGLRTAAFMGALSVVAASYHDHYAVSAGQFAFVWTLSGLAFFVANWWAGKALTRRDTRSVSQVGLVGAAVACGALAPLFAPAPLGLALAGTAALAAGHAVLAAAVTTCLVREGGALRGRALGMGASAQSAGVFVGASAAGLGFAVAGWTGTALALAFFTVLSALTLARYRAGIGERAR